MHRLSLRETGVFYSRAALPVACETNLACDVMSFDTHGSQRVEIFGSGRVVVLVPVHWIGVPNVSVQN